MKCYSSKEFKVGEIVIIQRNCEVNNQYAIVVEVNDGFLKVKLPDCSRNLIPSHGEVEKTNYFITQ
jgi:hypothetical protein